MLLIFSLSLGNLAIYIPIVDWNLWSKIFGIKTFSFLSVLFGGFFFFLPNIWKFYSEKFFQFKIEDSKKSVCINV